MGVSLIIKGPGGFEGGRVCDAMVSHMDVYPTLCELLGISKPEWLEGKSLLPLLHGETSELHEELFAEVTYHASYEPKRAVRTNRWKYIRRFDGRKTSVLPNCDDGWSKDYWLKEGWQTNPMEAEESLYDLVFDPNESNNLIQSPLHNDVIAEMRGRLNNWMRRTNDPLLRGPVPLPSGARTCDPDLVSDKDRSAWRVGS
jgi:arylsulfatase A-like enzyme